MFRLTRSRARGSRARGSRARRGGARRSRARRGGARRSRARRSRGQRNRRTFRNNRKMRGGGGGEDGEGQKAAPKKKTKKTTAELMADLTAEPTEGEKGFVKYGKRELTSEAWKRQREEEASQKEEWKQQRLARMKAETASSSSPLSSDTKKMMSGKTSHADMAAIRERRAAGKGP